VGGTMTVDEIRNLVSIEDADEFVTDLMLDETLDWFEDDRGVPTEEFIDRLCTTYADAWDIDNYDSPAARRILSRARKIKRGAQ
jgi:hypothetical protein